jgi:peroxiredoxin
MQMKIKSLLSLFTVILLAGSAFANKDGFSIKIKVSGYTSGTVQLANYYGDKQYLKDSAVVDNQGRFKFENKDGSLERGIYMVVMPDKRYFEFLIDSIQNFTMETDSSDYIGKMKIKGSPENILFYEYLNFITPRGKNAEALRAQQNEPETDAKTKAKIKEELAQLDKEVNDFKKNIQEKQPNSFVAKMFRSMTEPEIPEPPVLENGAKDSLFVFRYYKEHYWDNIDFSDDWIVRSPLYASRLKRYVENLTVQIPDSINKTADYLLEKAEVSPDIFKYTLWFITNTYERSNIMGMDAVFVHMVENYYMTGKAFWVDPTQLEKIAERAMTLKPILIGKTAPNILMRDLKNAIVPLHSVKAKYTILYFWDPDCGHCKKVTPLVRDIYKQYKDKGVQAYAVCMDVESDKMKKFIEDKELNWINVYDPYHQTNFRKHYDINSTPVLYLLNEKKEIIAKRIDAEQLREILQRQLD